MIRKNKEKITNQMIRKLLEHISKRCEAKDERNEFDCEKEDKYGGLYVVACFTKNC